MRLLSADSEPAGSANSPTTANTGQRISSFRNLGTLVTWPLLGYSTLAPSVTRIGSVFPMHSLLCYGRTTWSRRPGSNRRNDGFADHRVTNFATST